MTRIIIDSSTELSSAFKNRALVVPLTIHFDGQEYIDGVTIDHRKFYELLEKSDILPTTSQASPGAFADVYAEIRKAGDQAVVLTVSSMLSGTYQSAVIAAEDYPEIQVVDGRSIAIGTGILAEYALQLADRGLDAEHIALKLLQARDHVHVIAMLDTLEYLKKGGRISATAAVAGSLLSIKPVVAIRDGAISILGKARGSRQGNNLLVKEIEKTGGVDFTRPVLLGYTGCSDLLLKKYVADSERYWTGHEEALRICSIGSVVGTHAGPGAIAVAFFQP